MDKVQSFIGFFKISVVLKVSKFRNEFMMSSFLPKNEQMFFRISALASKKKSDQKNEGTLYHYLGGYLTYYCIVKFFDLHTF